MYKSILSPAAQAAYEVTKILQESGYDSRWVGGCVRDMLLNKSPKDFDIATQAVPDVVEHIFKEHPRFRTYEVGKSFGVIKLHDTETKTDVDVVTLRTEAGYTDARRPDVVKYTRSFQEDSSRRDFTMNAIYFDPISERMFDPWNGRQDIEDSIVKTVGKAYDRLTEDRLRILRAIRFACQLHFSVDQNLAWDIIKIQKECPGNVFIPFGVSRERMASELDKMFKADSICAWINLKDFELLPETLDISQGIIENTESHKLGNLALLDNPWHGLALLVAQGMNYHAPKVKYSILLDWAAILKLSTVGVDTEELAQFGAFCEYFAKAGEYSDKDFYNQFLRHIRRGFNFFVNNYCSEKEAIVLQHRADRITRLVNNPPISSLDILAKKVPQGPVFGKIKLAIETAIFDGDLIDTPESIKSFWTSYKGLDEVRKELYDKYNLEVAK